MSNADFPNQYRGDSEAEREARERRAWEKARLTSKPPEYLTPWEQHRLARIEWEEQQRRADIEWEEWKEEQEQWRLYEIEQEEGRKVLEQLRLDKIEQEEWREKWEQRGFLSKALWWGVMVPWFLLKVVGFLVLGVFVAVMTLVLALAGGSPVDDEDDD